MYRYIFFLIIQLALLSLFSLSFHSPSFYISLKDLRYRFAEIHPNRNA